ncbi:MAG: indole-3-glycerol phosphate synthase TrpC [Methanomassiliicoccaceae archaeon]|nr:indole-3-glycerol phosphate synthase TrpC [Methanomassiliicoccaceae archaeon]
MDILSAIVARTKERITEKKRTVPLDDMIKAADAVRIEGYGFERALRNGDIAFICETKKASPSKGVISDDYDAVRIAKEYERAGADAVSVLTEPYYFQGSDDDLRGAASEIRIPLLRKDFIVDEYMIYESRTLGADAVLLICGALEKDVLAKYISIAHGIGLSVLTETHSETEIRTALSAGARIIGVNNRDLRTFDVDLSLSERLGKMVPDDVLFVAESGIRTAEDVERLRNAGVDAVLIGETMMRSSDKRTELQRLHGDVND